MRRQPRRLNALTATLFGDWAGVDKFFKGMGIEVKKKTLEAQWEICKKLKKIVIGHLLAQDLNWAPLAESTKRQKSQNKELALIETETYIDNIRTWKRGGVAHVGVKKGTVYKRKGGTVNLERVAIWHEYGTSREPARPLWGPSIQELGGKAGIKDFVVEAIFRRLKWLARGKPIKVTRKQISRLVK